MVADEAGLVRRSGLWLRALIADSRGDTATVRRSTAEAHEHYLRTGPPLGTPLDPADDVVYVRLMLRIGERGRAVRAVDSAEQRAALNPEFPLLTAVAAHARALLDDDEDMMREAVRLLEGSPRLLVAASAWEDLAVMSTRAGEGAGLLAAAHDAYTGMGALHEAERVRGRLRSRGLRPRRRAQASPLGLTPSEFKVVRLAAEGKTNREIARELFLSPHTVGVHLRHAFARLGVGSRLALTKLVVDHGLA